MIYILGDKKPKGYIVVTFPTNTTSCLCKKDGKVLKCPLDQLGGGVYF